MKTIIPTRDVVKKHEKSTNKAMSLFEKTMKKLMVEDDSIEADMAKEQAKIDRALEILIESDLLTKTKPGLGKSIIGNIVIRLATVAKKQPN